MEEEYLTLFKQMKRLNKFVIVLRYDFTKNIVVAELIIGIHESIKEIPIPNPSMLARKSTIIIVIPIGNKQIINGIIA